MTNPSAAGMPETVANAIKLLWLSLIIMALIFVWTLTYGFSFGAVVRFAIIGGLWAFAITLLPSRNNIARLVIMGVTAYNVVMLLLGVLGSFSFLFTIPGLLSIASLGAAALGSYLLFQSDDWFGPLTKVSL